MDTESYRYQKFLSDISGQDIRMHGNDCRVVIKNVREFLMSNSGKELISANAIISKFDLFISHVNELSIEKGYDDITNIFYLDFKNIIRYFNNQLVKNPERFI